MLVSDYELPEASIAQSPVEPRDAARLLVSLAPDEDTQHRLVRDLPEFLGPGDVVVVNNSRVLPARLRLHKDSGGAAEILLLEPDRAQAVPAAQGRQPAAEPPSATWIALVRPGRRLPPGTVLHADGRAVLEVGERLDDGRRRVRLLGERPDELLEQVGTIPLPPYIHQPLADPDRYQTVYAQHPGSVAAPTAGLHLTQDLLERCRAAGAEIQTVDLAVGLGTFRPMSSPRVEDHVMHAERYRVPPATMKACEEARRVITVGTTTVRALESAAASGALEGRSELFIHGDYPFALVDVLLTNFHQPRSTLLLLLEAFCGARWQELYRQALEQGYRFLSFGDAMVVGRDR